MNIVNSLSKNDIRHILNGGFKKSHYIKYRQVLLIDNTPISFIEAYQLPNMLDNELSIVIACKDEFRENGYITLLINNFIEFCRSSSKYEIIYYKVKDGDTKNEIMAESLGFHRINNPFIGSDYIMDVGTKYYRFTYLHGDVGIYEVLKRNVSLPEWKRILNSKYINWLPKPPMKYEGLNSYFTALGLNMFIIYTLPLIGKYLNTDNIIASETTNVDNKKIVYRDPYQIMVRV